MWTPKLPHLWGNQARVRASQLSSSWASLNLGECDLNSNLSVSEMTSNLRDNDSQDNGSNI